MTCLFFIGSAFYWKREFILLFVFNTKCSSRTWNHHSVWYNSWSEVRAKYGYCYRFSALAMYCSIILWIVWTYVINANICFVTCIRAWPTCGKYVLFVPYCNLAAFGLNKEVATLHYRYLENVFMILYCSSVSKECACGNFSTCKWRSLPTSSTLRVPTK